MIYKYFYQIHFLLIKYELGGILDDDNYESQKMKYSNFRDFLIVLLRMIASRFNTIVN